MKLKELMQLPENKIFLHNNAIEILSETESFFAKKDIKKIDIEFWHNYLNITRKPEFLQALKTTENRNRWVEVVFKIIQLSDYRFLDLMEQRVTEMPNKVLFQAKSRSRKVKWTYKQIFAHVKEIAAFIHKLKPEKPRVAMFIRNSVETASIDLACMSYDIFNTPLNIHFSSDILEYVFNELKIDIVITDTRERLKVVIDALKNIDRKIEVIATEVDSAKSKYADYYLGKECKNISAKEAENILNKRKKLKLNEVATTMFTSGSTGMPKGVSFSIYNIVSKRFARAAALPKVGNDETFICYLPLFHTFGRYLEITGSIFWGGTYIMAENPSAATLLPMFSKENPTGFISVPIRWQQLYDNCIEATDDIENESEKEKIIRKIIGKKLHWGLSAAGYLDPKVFRFFHKHGVSLNSGFGMTEATGGITMTPSFNYIENSTGLPLPGMQTRLNQNNELELKGHYLAKYLPDAGPGDIIPYPHEEDYWLPTGDIFTIDENGFHEIIDRVKDIYKNNKGQTVAPGMVEKKFAGVPGIKRTFLVGDGRPYNVLLIVQDNDDPVIKSMPDESNKLEYFHQIVMSANKDVAPYERVINFTIIDRDFSAEKGELTPKGSYKRKKIEHNFSKLIVSLYKKNHIIFIKDDFEIIIPRWFYRDLGILETDIEINKKGIYNKRSKKSLTIIKGTRVDFYQIGNFEYKISKPKIDLGRITRQPKLWVGNPELIQFSPCKESFDLPLKNISPQLCLPLGKNNYKPDEVIKLKGVYDSDLFFINNIISTALHGKEESALQSLSQLGQLFSNYDNNKTEIIRRRLEAFACHHSEILRIRAYQILLLHDPDPNYSEVLPSFINSGKTFLNEQSINEIIKSKFSIEHLRSFRKRMHAYKVGLSWPANEQTRKQFDTIFKLLLNFGLKHPEYYKELRAEFASWVTLKEEPVLSKKAEKYFFELYRGFEKSITEKTKPITRQDWESKITFDEGISGERKEAIKTKLSNSNFLKQSIIMAYDDFSFTLDKVKNNGIWVSRVKNYRNSHHYRMSINTLNGKHYDIHIVIDKKVGTRDAMREVYRHIELSGFPYGSPAIAQFACGNINDKILSSRYVSHLPAWEKIRSFVEIKSSGYGDTKNALRKIYIRSMSTFYKAWDNSNRKILPGFISPNNVVVPEVDFSDNARIISLSGWKEIDKIYPFFLTMYKNFYYKTSAHYPSIKKYLNKRWIFHACVETFGKTEALKIMNKLKAELAELSIFNELQLELLTEVGNYLDSFTSRFYLPLALFNAIDRFTDWKIRNQKADIDARLQTIDEMYELYNLEKYPEIIRYKFYRDTYFANAKSAITKSFDKLLTRMGDDINILAIQLTELSDLQATMKSESDKNIFGKMVFPDIKDEQKVDIIKIGKEKEEQVVVLSTLKDKKDVEYTMREPVTPGEVGAIYKLFFKENYPKKITKMDNHYVVIDANEQVVGGLCYKNLDNDIVLIDGMAVTSPLHGRGVGSAMMLDFFTRMKAQQKKLIKAHFLFGNYYLKHNFKIDKKWGALVKEL